MIFHFILVVVRRTRDWSHFLTNIIKKVNYTWLYIHLVAPDNYYLWGRPHLHFVVVEKVNYSLIYL